MKTKILERGGVRAAFITAEGIIVGSTENALDILGNCMYNDIRTIIIPRENFSPEFFELRTGIAGDILQKFTTYNVRLAIIGDFSAVESKSLRDFVRESNRGKRIIFVPSAEEAMEIFSGL